jgi:hypothetical protein
MKRLYNKGKSQKAKGERGTTVKKLPGEQF